MFKKSTSALVYAILTACAIVGLGVSPTHASRPPLTHDQDGLHYSLNVDGSSFRVGEPGLGFGSGCAPGGCPSSVTIPDNLTFDEISYPVTAVDDWAFYNISVDDLTISSNVTSIGGSAFFHGENGGPTSLTLGYGVTLIGEYAFAGARLIYLDIPANVQVVNLGAFQRNPTLKSVEFGSGLTSLGGRAFFDCPNLETIRFRGAMPTLGADIFAAGSSSPINYTSTHAASWTSPPDNSPHTYVEVSAPAITDQPDSQTVTIGQSATFVVSADGESMTPNSYQWYRDGNPIDGATTNTLTVGPNDLSADGAIISVDALNWVGYTSSSAATLTVTKQAQSARISLPTRLVPMHSYALPRRTIQGIPITWRVRGYRTCIVRNSSLRCSRIAPGSVTIIGTAGGSATLLAFRLQLRRRIL